MMKRVIMCALSCVMLVLYLACPLLAAEVVRPNAVAFTDSNAYADILAGSNGNTEAMQKYLKNDTKTEPEFVTAAEYGYYGAKDNSANYRLYVYIYNPSGTALPATGNTITLATKFSDQAKTDITAAGAMSYATFSLKAAEPQTANPDEYKTTLYKYYVDLYEYWKKSAVSKVDGMIVGNYRRYDISKVTINGVAVTVGNSLICEGLASENKTPLWKGIQTERLEVTPAVYRHMTDSNVNTQVNSVYFAVPDKYWQQVNGKDIYDLTEIKADWIEKRTTPILVTNDQALNDEYVAMKIIGANMLELQTRPERSVYCNLSAGDQFINRRYAMGGWRFNDYPDKDGVFCAGGNSAISALYWMFYRKVDDLKDAMVTSAEMTDWYKAHPEWHDKMFTDDITNQIPENKNGAVITADQLINIAGRDVAGIQQWWEKLLGYDYDYSSISNVSPIQHLTEEEWAEQKGLSNDALSKKYLISEDEVAGFREKMDEMIENNKVKEKCRMVVFHFAVTDYETYLAGIVTNGTVLSGGRQVFPAKDQLAYMAAEDVFLNFDIIYMAFTSEVGDRLVVPTVMSPIDIISDVTPPAMADKVSVIIGREMQSMWDKLKAWLEEMKEQLGRVVAIVLGLVLLAVCWPLITAVLRFLASILRGVGRGANRLMDAAKRRKNKHKKE